MWVVLRPLPQAPKGSWRALKRVLVAGATGYLGGHLVTELKQRGHWVRALVRRPQQAPALAAADDTFVGQVTDPTTLRGVADDVDIVFSTIGVTRPRDRFGYDQVDYGGNLTLLKEAERSHVGRFVYVAVYNGPQMRRSVRLADAKERFVSELTASPVAHTIVRPTGFFSDMRAFLDMARSGRTYLIGDGLHTINPVSGRDVAVACIEAAASGIGEIEVGGPDVFTHRQIAELAAAVAGRPARITHIPAGVLRAAAGGLRLVGPERVYGPLQFFLAVMTMDMVAPARGTDHLRDFLEQEHESAAR